MQSDFPTDMKPKSLMVFPNFNVACFSQSGDQIAELQTSLLLLWAEHAIENGYDPDGLVCETQDGSWQIFRTKEGGWNYRRV